MEDRWTRAKLGFRVRGWEWDGMVGSHVIDNRPDITSLKFQAFVRLGLESYDGAVRPFLKANKAKGGNTPNRVGKADLEKLLIYNGIDSLATYLLCEKQIMEVCSG